MPDVMDYEHIENLLREARKQLPESGLRDRIDAAVVDQELTCPKCDHYWWNHNADGPCAVRESYPDACSCLGNLGRRDALLRTLRGVMSFVANYRVRLLNALIVGAAFIVGMVLR